MIKKAISVHGLYILGLNLVLAAASVQATDYYVSTTGNDSNPGTSAQPFATITHAYAAASAGTTIHVAPGVYYDYTSGWGIHLGKSGTASSPIVLQSQVLHGAIIDRQNASDGHQGFYMDGSYNIVNGFEVRNAPLGGFAIYGNGNQILNNHIHHNGTPASSSTNGRDGAYSDPNTSGTIYAGNWIDHNGRAGSNLDHGLYLCGKNEIVCNNVLYANSASGLQIAGYTTVSNMKVYNNVMAWNGVSGIILWQALSGVDIKNNILYQNAHYGVGSYAAKGSGVVVDNNILQGNGYGDLDFTAGGSSYSYSQSGNIIADPGLVNESAASFDPHLASGSRAIQAGLNLSSVFRTDMAGAPRPGTGPWDLGVYAVVSNSIATLPDVSLTATTPNASRVGPANGVFTITRSGDTTLALTVNCSLGGSASSGLDYIPIVNPLTIAAGSASTTVTVTPLPATNSVGSRTVALTLTSNSAYSLGTTNNATVTIAGNGLPCGISLAPGNNVKITWASVAGKIYRVACKNNLNDATWNNLSGPITATSTSTAYTDTTASGKSQCFYIVFVTN